MITSLTIEGFKRFNSQSFALKGLTLLTGLNGSGKTSVIHAMLLAHEATKKSSASIVPLNGPFGIELGTVLDVRNWDSEGDIRIQIDSSGNERGSTWRFSLPKLEDSLYLNVKEIPQTLPVAYSHEPRTFTYLCAERLGPRTTLGSAALPDFQLEVGVRGEFCAQVLGTLGGSPLIDGERLHPERAPDTAALLKYEIEAWLNSIVRPIEIEAVQMPGVAVTSLRFRQPGGDWVHAPNMGFGVSYALPIIMAGLIAEPGSLFIVENPEAHLHPAGQSQMGLFLAWLAGKGVQVIVETHSDHVLNGIRRAIGQYGYLAAEDAVVHFFDFQSAGGAPTELVFTKFGSMSAWPQGFFDQYQVDVASLGRLRRRGE